MRAPSPNGSLVIVGTGIQALTHLTADARLFLQESDRVFYLVADPLTEEMILELRPEAESLASLYAPGKHRMKTYRQMTDRILEPVRTGRAVCAAFYGHPGVFALAPHAAMRIAQSEGYSAQLLPAVSAEACLFADLGVDPGARGWQSYEATNFLLQNRQPDTTAGLVLWQIGFIGETDYRPKGANRRNLAVLAKVLAAMYGPEHRAILYEASTLPGLPATVHRTSLGKLAAAPVTGITTLYVPPLPQRPPDPKMIARLGMSHRDLAACVR